MASVTIRSLASRITIVESTDGEPALLVVIHIKELFSEAVTLYQQELCRLVNAREGRIAFMLIVEDTHSPLRNDFPSTFSALSRAREALGADFLRIPTIHIADGGLKQRNLPNTILYGFQGLMPLPQGKTYLEESIARTGPLLQKLPNQGSGLYVILPSDGVFDFSRIALPENDQARHSGLTLVLIPTTSQDITSKVVALTAPLRHSSGDKKDDTVTEILAKPPLKEWEDRNPQPSQQLWTLPFVMIWQQESLGEFLQELADSNGRSLVEFPGDFFASFIEGLFLSETQHEGRCPKSVELRDWKQIYEVARNRFGRRAKHLAFARLPDKLAFQDDGHSESYRSRIKLSGPPNAIKKDRSVRVEGADRLSCRNVFIRGSGSLRLGKFISMENVAIDLGPKGHLKIPDGWVLKDSYVGPEAKFKGPNGFLLAAVWSGAGQLLPVNEKFLGGHQSSVASIRNGVERERLVTIPFRATRAVLDAHTELYKYMDPVSAVERLKVWKDWVQQICQNWVPPYPLVHSGVASPMKYRAAVNRVGQIVELRRRPKHRFWVTIEGLQCAGKSSFAADLARFFHALHVPVIVIEEDWWTKDRRERDLLRQSDREQWTNHRQSWHRWDMYRRDMAQISETGLRKQESITLEGLYDPNDPLGTADRSQTLILAPGTVIIHTGFYLSDEAKFRLPSDPFSRFRIYLGITQDDSLTAKLQRDTLRGRDEAEIKAFDEEVYRPSLRDYIVTFDPATSSDAIFGVNVTDRSVLTLMDLRRGASAMGTSSTGLRGSR